MTERRIDHELRLIPYYRNDAVLLLWYQDPDVCKQVDDRDAPYDLELLQLAREKGLARVQANIYAFNGQSQRMFRSAGFRKIDAEWYEYVLQEEP